jgi:hypothetical protein
VRGVPTADAEQQHHADHGREREPSDASLPVAQHDDRGKQRPDRRAEIPAHLKQRLREAGPVAGRHSGDARGLRVQDRRASSDERGSRQ